MLENITPTCFQNGAIEIKFHTLKDGIRRVTGLGILSNYLLFSDYVKPGELLKIYY
jgi:hypothetical protein